GIADLHENSVSEEITIFGDGLTVTVALNVSTMTMIARQLDDGRSGDEVAGSGADELDPRDDAAIPIFAVTRDGNLAAIDSAGNGNFIAELAKGELIRHAAGDLQAVVGGRLGQAGNTERVAHVERGENAQIGCE